MPGQILANIHNESELMRIIPTLTSTELDEQLNEKDADGHSTLRLLILNYALKEQSEELQSSGLALLKLLLEKASSVAIQTAVLNSHGESALHTASWRSSEEAYQYLLSKLTDETIRAAVLRPNKVGTNALRLAIKYQSTKGLHSLLWRLANGVLDFKKLAEIFTTEHNGISLWQTIHRIHPVSLLPSVSLDLMAEIFKLQKKNPGIALLYAVHNVKENPDLLAVLKTASPNVIVAGLGFKAKINEGKLFAVSETEALAPISLGDKEISFSPLHSEQVENVVGNALYLLARREESGYDLLVTIRYKIDHELFDKAMIRQDGIGWTAFNVAAYHQIKPEYFMTILNTVMSPESINRALLINNKWGISPLYTIAVRQSKVAFLVLILKAEKAVLCKSFLQREFETHCPINAMLLHHDDEVLSAVLAKTDFDIDIMKRVMECDGNRLLTLLINEGRVDKISLLLQVASPLALYRAIVPIEQYLNLKFAIEKREGVVKTSLLGFVNFMRMHVNLVATAEVIHFDPLWSAANIFDDGRLNYLVTVWKDLIRKFKGSMIDFYAHIMGTPALGSPGSFWHVEDSASLALYDSDRDIYNSIKNELAACSTHPSFIDAWNEYCSCIVSSQAHHKEGSTSRAVTDSIVSVIRPISPVAGAGSAATLVYNQDSGSGKEPAKALTAS